MVVGKSGWVEPYEMREWTSKAEEHVRSLVLLRVSSTEQDVVSLLQIILSAHATSLVHVYVLIIRVFCTHAFYLII